MAAGERRSTSGNAVTTSPTANFNSAASSFVVADATGYPDGTNGPFFVKIDSETIKITGRTGTTFNVQTTPVTGRGWDNTSAASHTTASTVNLVFTATDADNANEHYASVAVDHHTQYLNIARHDLTARHPASVLPLGSPGNSAPGDTANAGVAASVARSDHRHGREADSTTRVGCTLSTASQALTSSTISAISWTTETTDTDGFITAPGTTLTIPAGKGGIYDCTVNGAFTTGFTEDIYVYLLMNGVAYTAPVLSNAFTFFNWSLAAAGIPLSAGNTVSLSIVQFNAGSKTTSANINLYRVGA